MRPARALFNRRDSRSNLIAANGARHDGGSRRHRRIECDTHGVADATNDATIRPGHCVLRKRPDEPNTHPRKRVFLRPGYSRIGNAGAFCLAPSSGLPPRHFLLAPGPVSPRHASRRLEAAARWATAGIRRTQAARTCNAAPRSSRSKAGLPPPGNWIPATGLRAGPIFPGASRPSRYRSESCRSSRMHRPRRGRIAALAWPPPAVP